MLLRSRCNRLTSLCQLNIKANIFVSTAWSYYITTLDRRTVLAHRSLQQHRKVFIMVILPPIKSSTSNSNKYCKPQFDSSTFQFERTGKNQHEGLPETTMMSSEARQALAELKREMLSIQRMSRKNQTSTELSNSAKADADSDKALPNIKGKLQRQMIGLSKEYVEKHNTQQGRYLGNLTKDNVSQLLETTKRKKRAKLGPVYSKLTPTGKMLKASVQQLAMPSSNSNEFCGAKHTGARLAARKSLPLNEVSPAGKKISMALAIADTAMRPFEITSKSYDSRYVSLTYPRQDTLYNDDQSLLMNLIKDASHKCDIWLRQHT